jgi:hypothetical protein
MDNYELIQRHDKGTKLCSLMNHMKSVSPTYNEIISKGKDILPDILKYLRDYQGGMNVMLLLWKITKTSPYKPEKINGTAFAGFDVSAARQAWIEWGKKEKLIA